MKTKFAIASIATVAALASMGSAFAGELYSPSEGQFTPVAVTAPMAAVNYVSGGELYPQVDRQTNQSVASTNAAQPAPSFYALGGELGAPTHRFNGPAVNTNIGE